MRMRPREHRFTYRVFNLLVDIDRLDALDRMSALFSVNRFNLVSFHERDHHDGEAPTLRAYIDNLIGKAGLDRPAKIWLLCYPRVANYVFNPISVYFCHGSDGEISALIYEVRNTFGEKHCYVCPVAGDQVSPASIRQERAKALYVSPFIPMDMRYLFRINPPQDSVRIRILEMDEEGPLLSATFSGDRRPLKSAVLTRELVRAGFLTLKITAGIHVEALKLWLKGTRLVARPKPPGAYSVGNGVEISGPAAGPAE